jgi:uncharacterized protein (DUF342 family)
VVERTSFDVETLLNSVDSLVAEVELGSQSMAELAKVQSGFVEPGSRTRLDDLDALLSPVRDGFVDIQVSEDAMTVTADFYPALGAGSGVTINAVELQLEKLGVVNGILFPVVRAAVAEADLQRKVQEHIIIAKGTPPVDFVAEHWEVIPELLEKKRSLDNRALTLDFKKESPFVVVRSGDRLAVRFQEQFGSSGWDVFGRPIEASTRNPPPIQPGPLVSTDSQGFFAQSDGCLHVYDGIVEVRQILVLEEGINYQTGNIDFPGDVQILGPISSGFTVRAKGSVLCNQVMDVAELIAGGDLVTQFGVVGQEGCRVIVGGRLQAKFLEKAIVQAQREVKVQSSILNSVVQTRDRVVLGEKGILMGGRIQAQNGIDVFQVGSTRGVKAELVCGMDFEVTEKMSWAQEQCMKLVRQIKQLNEFAAVHPAQGPKIRAAVEKLRSQVTHLGETSRTLALQMDRNDEASVVVRGTIYPGTYIEICHVSYVVTRELSRVRFSLDKKHGTVRAEPL